MLKKITIGMVGVALIVSPFIASAHERQLFSIGGTDYLFTIGSLGEPIIVDDKTGVDIRVKVADPKDPTNANAPGAKPVEGLEKTLKVELISGEKKKTTELSAVYGQAGSYKNTFYPTVDTMLTYRIFGTINETPVDISFSCNMEGHVMTGAMTEDTANVPMGNGVVRKFKSGQYGCPKAKESFGFPSDTTSLANLHDGIHEEIGSVTEDFANDPVRSQAGASLALGILGTILGIVAIRKSRTPKM